MRKSGEPSYDQDPAIRAARRLALECDPDPDHAEQVARLSLELFDRTKTLHGLGDDARRLLFAAALVHDTGLSVSPLQHHKHSRDIVLKTSFGGLSGKDVKVVACVARYHRKAHPNESHRMYRDLEPTRQEMVRRLAALLRIADGLDRSHSASARSLEVEMKPDQKRLRLYVEQRRPSPIDESGAMNKRRLFEEVYDVTVEIIPRIGTPSGGTPHEA